MIPPLFGKQEIGIWWVQKRFPRYGVPVWSLWPNIRSLPSIVADKKCDEKCACMFNVYKNQQSRQTGSRNLMGPKTLPTIWDTYMKLVTKYQISVINSYWEKCDENYLGRMEERTEVKQYTPSHFGERGYKKIGWRHKIDSRCQVMEELILLWPWWV